jgi:hypothetical protein
MPGIKNPEKMRIADFGEVWRAKLLDLADDPTIGLRAMARTMGVDPGPIKHHLKLARAPENNATTKCLSSIDENKIIYRALWKDTCAAYPSESSTAIRKRVPSAYTWLYRHDRDWLKANQPFLRKPKSETPRVNWPERDHQLRKEAENVVRVMKEQTGKPTKISVTAIARELKCLSLITHNQDKLPETWQYLQSVAESRVDFACRRIRWVAEQCCHRQEVPEEWELIRMAGIREELLDDIYPVLKEAHECISSAVNIIIQ